MVATWYGDDSPHQSLPNSQSLSVAVWSVRHGKKARLVIRVNIQVPQTWSLLNVVRCSTSLKTMKAVIKMIIKGRKSNNETRIGQPTEFALDWLFDRINLEHQKHPNQVCWHQNTNSQTCFTICLTSAISTQFCCSQNFSSASCPKKRWRNKMANKMQQGHGEERNCSKVEADVEPGFEDLEMSWVQM